MGKVRKKAQVTIFMVLGLIILVTVLVFFFIQRSAFEESAEVIIEKQKPEFAGQIELKSYVDTCLQDVVLQGLEIISLQGGYINIPNYIQTLKVKDLENSYQVKTVDGSKVVVQDQNGLGNDVPFWLSKDKLAVPSIFFIENELKEYVTKELNKCVDDFKPFKEQNFEITYDNINTEVIMANSVITKINFPINAKKTGIEFDLEDFILTVPINMQLIIDMASGITGFENTATFLEDHTKNLISLYSGLDENSLPPFSQSFLNLDCDSVSWSKQTTQERLKVIFEQFIPHLKIQNTKFERPSYALRSQQNIFDSFIYEFFNEKFPTLSIDFSYRPEWEFFEYDIKPNQGDLILPDRSVHTIPLVGRLCLFDYDYKYTFDVPILAEINDDESANIDPIGNVYFENKGFKLQYAVDAYLCGNQNRLCTGRPDTTIDVTSFLAENDVTVLPDTLFCDLDQRIHDVKIKTLDSSDISLDNVDIYYSCGSYKNNCFIGRTDTNGNLATKFPSCINGLISLQKKDYADVNSLLTVHDTDLDLEFKLEPIKEINVLVKKVNVSGYVRQFFETGSLETDDLILDLQSEETASLNANGPQLLFYLQPNSVDNKIKLSSGLYNLTLTINGFVELEAATINGQFFESLEGNFPFGTVNFDWNVDEIGNSVTFFGLSEYDAASVFTFEDISDQILRPDGNLEAELLYQCEREFDVVLNDFICDFNNCFFVATSGTVINDFVDNIDTCEITHQVSIGKNQYEPFIQPKFT